jgi:hypothetical protein
VNALENARWAIEEEERHRATDRYQRGSKAMRLAPTLDVYHALLRGESVPIDRIDQKWFIRLGGKRPC